jgi:3-deoxy-manno-octulosonate cytidylyltransferase (CMP-KDO synthetase)
MVCLFLKKMEPQFLGIIPARFASTRFPGKPLAVIGNKPMIQWVYERASTFFPRLVVATDDERIREAVSGFGGSVLMTSASHRTGTERCAEALELFCRQHPDQVTHVVNIQGDEPMLSPAHLKTLISCFDDPETMIATLIRPVDSASELTDPNVVKVVVDKRYMALYFSRSAIPHVRDPYGSGGGPPPFHAHIGLYAFRAEVLKKIVRLPVSPLERAESLEQLRWLENGYPIRTALTHEPSVGVDTPGDLEKIRKQI